MSLSKNYGHPNMPRIVRNLFGHSTTDRTTIKLPMKDSAALYMGAFVPAITGASGSELGAEFGIPAFTDDSLILGFVVGFTRDGLVPIQDDPLRAGSITDQTGVLPFKYTASSTNDQENTTSAKLELVEIMPIVQGDVIEITLFGGSTASVGRGTTTAYGTTASSANIGVGMSVNTTYQFALLESSASNTLANLDFMTTLLDGKYPQRNDRVYALPLRTVLGGKTVAD